MKKIAAILGLAVAMQLATVTASEARPPKIWYVSAAIAVNGDGSAATPFKTLADAIAGGAGDTDGDEIRVGVGDYNLGGTAFSFPNLPLAATGVTLKGGYPGWNSTANTFDFANRDFAGATTITSTGPMFVMDARSTVDGFKLVHNSGNWTFSFNDTNSTVQNVDLTTTSQSIFYVDSLGAGARILSNKIVTATNTCTLLQANSDTVFEGNTVTGNANCGSSFFDIYGKSVIKNNTVTLNYSSNVVTVRNLSDTTFEGNTVTVDSNNWVINVENTSSLLAQDNKFNQLNGGNGIYVNNNSRATIRRNEIYLYSGNALQGGGQVSFYQNLVSGFEWNSHQARGFIADSSPYHWKVSNNNFTLLKHVFYNDDTLNYGSASTYSSDRWVDVRDNAMWFNGFYEGGSPPVCDWWGCSGSIDEIPGYIGLTNYPYVPVAMAGNCIDSGANNNIGYIDTYSDLQGHLKNPATFDADIPGFASGTQVLTTPPANANGPVCGTKGKVTGTILVKPVAVVFATDVTNSSYLADLAVAPGEPFTLHGGKSINFQGGDLTYTWTQTAGPVTLALKLLNPSYSNAAVTGFTDTPGVYKFRLQVRNAGADNVLSDPAFVTVTVMPKIVVSTSTGATRGSYKWLQDAVYAAQPGDTITLPNGLFIINNTSYVDGSGNTWSGAVVSIYGKRDLVIQGSGDTTLGFREWTAFDIEYSRNITIRNMKIIDIEGDRDEMIYVYQSVVNFDRVVMDGLPTDYDDDDGIYADYSDVRITNSSFSNLYDAIYSDGSGKLSVSNSSFLVNSDYSIYVYFTENSQHEIEILNNNFDNRTEGEYVIYVDEATLTYKPALISGNRIANYDSYAMYLEDLYQKGAIVNDNVIYNNRIWTTLDTEAVYINYALIEFYNNIVFYAGDNLLEVDGGGSSTEDGYGNVVVSNNVFYGSLWANGIYNYNFSQSESFDGQWLPLTSVKNNLVFGNMESNFMGVLDLGGNVEQEPYFADPDRGNFALTSKSPAILSTFGPKAKSPSPTGLKAEPLMGGAMVSFNSVEGASDYKVYWGTSSASLDQSRATAGDTALNIDGLASMAYHVAVAAVNSNGEGPQSASVVVTPSPAAVSEQSTPTVEGVFPYRFASKSVIELEISGSGFQDGAKVFIGSVPLDEVTFVDENTLKVKTTKDVRYGVQPVSVVNTDLGRGALAQAVVVYRAGEEGSGGCSSTSASDASLVLLLVASTLFFLRRRSN